MNPINRQKPKIVEKEWGREEIIHNDENYCCKFLHLEQGKRCSLHLHKIKKETFRILQGEIVIKLIDMYFHMRKGDYVTVNPGTLHSFYGLRNSVILEVSTQDFVEDSYRVDKSGSFNIPEIKSKANICAI